VRFQAVDDTRKERAKEGPLDSDAVANYFLKVLAPKHPSYLYLDPAFYTQLLESSSSRSTDRASLKRWFKKRNLPETEKVEYLPQLSSHYRNSDFRARPSPKSLVLGGDQSARVPSRVLR
jgi:hypothetical protein